MKNEDYKIPEGESEKRPKRRRIWAVILFLVLIIPIIYFAVQIFIVMMPRMNIQTAIQDTITDSLTVQGFVSLESNPVRGSGGVLYYTVPEGQRVAAGAEVALVFADAGSAEAMVVLDQINSELEMLEEAQRTVVEGGDVEGILKQMDVGLLEYLNVIDSGTYAGIDEAKNGLTLAANRLQVVTREAEDFEARIDYLNSQKLTYESKVSPIGSLTASETGYFVSASKYDRIPPSADVLDAAAPQALEQLLSAEPEYYGEDVIGHIVFDYKWRFYTTVPLEEAAKFVPEEKLELTFPEAGDAVMPMKVESVTLDEENNLAKIVLFCENMNPNIMRMRLQTAQIIFRTEKGIRIDKNALRIIEGNKCVYVKFGNQVYLRKIEVLIEDEHYLLVPDVYEAGVNEVELYDEIVVESGGVELYDKKVI